MDPAQFVTSIASQGLLGIVLIVVSWVAWTKDRELKVEREARIADAKGYTELALKLQEKVIDAVNKLADILEAIRGQQQPPPPVPPPGRTTHGGYR